MSKAARLHDFAASCLNSHQHKCMVASLESKTQQVGGLLGQLLCTRSPVTDTKVFQQLCVFHASLRRRAGDSSRARMTRTGSRGKQKRNRRSAGGRARGRRRTRAGGELEQSRRASRGKAEEEQEESRRRAGREQKVRGEQDENSRTRSSQ